MTNPKMTTPKTGMTISASDPQHVLLDPSKAPGLQAGGYGIDPVYAAYLPELSQLADRIFRDKIVDLKNREARTVSIWKPGQTEDGRLTIPREAAVLASGTPVPMSDVRPKIVVPTRTPLVDPRADPFKGNLDLAATYIAFTLAAHVHSEMERLKAETRKDMQVWCGDVSIIGETPAELAGNTVNGLRLSDACPMLYGRLFVYIDRK